MSSASYNLAAVLARLHSEPWLVTAEAHTGLVAALERVSASEFAGMFDQLAKQAADRARMDVSDGIATIKVEGMLMRSPGLIEKLIFGASDLGDITANLSEATRNPAVRGIFLSVDSPGGTVTGIPEAANLIAQAAKAKPVVAFTDGMMASAAYWLGSQATMIVASPSANVGSIGVYVPWRDTSAQHAAAGVKVNVVKNTGGTFKGMGHPGTSLNDEQLAHMQARVDEIFGLFKGAVTTARRRVNPDAMRGQVMLGRSAQSAGLVDVIGDQLSAWRELDALSAARPV